MKRQLRSSALALLATTISCATVELQPPVRATAGLAGHGVEIQVAEMVMSEDMLVDEAEDISRLVFIVDFENHGLVPNRVDLGATSLLARIDGVPESATLPRASGWSPLPSGESPTRALPVDLRPGERRRGWVVFEVPAAARPEAPARPALSLRVDVEDGSHELVVASPTGPRWRRPVTGPLRLGLSTAMLVAPNVAGGALPLRLDFSAGGTAIRFSVGPLAARSHDRAYVGSAAGVQVDLPSFHPSAWLRATPFLALETVIALPSFPTGGEQAVTLGGTAGGFELGFGTLAPPNAARLPLDYVVPVSPLSLRLAYVRWWGSVDAASLGKSGASGLLASLIVALGP